VQWISPDCIEDEKQGPVYKIRVQMARLSMDVNGKEIAITPGMAVSAEIKTDRRRIIEFFLSPLITYAKESLTLR
jgi:hemolysin D